LHAILVQKLIHSLVEDSPAGFLHLHCCYVRVAGPRDLIKLKSVGRCYRGEGNTHATHKNPITPAEVKVWVGIENPTSIAPVQSDDSVMEYIERETFSEVLLETRMEKIVSPLEEIPSVVKLDAGQLGEPALVIFGAEMVIDDCRREDGARADSADDELIVLDNDGIQRVESGHEVVRRGRRRDGVISI
jgi:hypothetical protein